MEHIFKCEVKDLKLKINAGSIKHFAITFSKREDIQIVAMGDLSQYSIQNERTYIEIRTTDKTVISLPDDKITIVESLVIDLPEEMTPHLDLQAIDSYVVLDYQHEQAFPTIRIDGVGINTELKNITSNVSFNALNSILKTDGLLGNIDINGLNTTLNVYNIQETNLKVNGLAATITIHEEGQPSNFNIKVMGLNATVRYHQYEKKGLGKITFQSPQISGAPYCNISGTGVKTTITIHE
ncbi:MAG: hypothetical protein RR565_06470 [Erysipelothrix sp.]